MGVAGVVVAEMVVGAAASIVQGAAGGILHKSGAVLAMRSCDSTRQKKLVRVVAANVVALQRQQAGAGTSKILGQHADPDQIAQEQMSAGKTFLLNPRMKLHRS